MTIDPKIWDTKTGRAIGRSAVALETNRMLDKIRVKINSHYQEIFDRDNYVTAEKVKKCLFRVGTSAAYADESVRAIQRGLRETCQCRNEIPQEPEQVSGRL